MEKIKSGVPQDLIRDHCFFCFT